MRINFNNDIDFDSKEPLSCFLNDEELIFTKYEKYVGPCTMQYLPNGGILSLFNYEIIIQVKNGMLGVKELVYKNKSYTSEEFLEEFKDLSLVNEVLV